ncbi:Arylsulfatase [Planctomycetes bacterium Pan216]|uniref:Arylsulfatase n=1 Tax=Kolteria novifilia TaxID=2527975 RepID=A0A518AX24_9BACT|nr:Arylsulfatase [Planctomycetes bacterium Pan216]
MNPLFVLGLLGIAASGVNASVPDMRPNILLLISDDQSWLHTSVMGDKVVKTPAFDQLAREGVLFPNAFASAPTCTASRGALLTGQDLWRLGPGANQRSTLPAEHETYPDLLAGAGYHVGCGGKGWAPGNVKAGGRKAPPAGKPYKSFASFLKAKPPGAPFCYWFGSKNPHRPYDLDSGVRAGKDPAAVDVPPSLPDSLAVRKDLLDYYLEIERFDREVAGILAKLDRAGFAENTIVVVTSDNGMPFPRGKANLYDLGVRMPLVIRWPAEIPPNRVIEDFVSLVDVAPTFLAAAGLQPPRAMTGHSLLPVLRSDRQGIVDSACDRAFFGRERHALWYPSRAIRTRDYLYIRNYRPETTPRDCDPSPSLGEVLARWNDPVERRFYDQAFARRPAEELYDLRADPDQLVNVAAESSHATARKRLSKSLSAYQRETNDPWLVGDGAYFKTAPTFRPKRLRGRLNVPERPTGE